MSGIFKIFIWTLIGVTLSGLSIMSGRAAGLESASFGVRESVMSDGGEKSSSARWIEQATVGGPVAVGISTSTRYLLKSGFQYFDESPPDISGAILNDGLGEDIDEQTSLGIISANWSGIFDPESGLDRDRPYEVSLQRQSDGQAWNPIAGRWQENASFFTTSTKITLSGVNMETDEIYFFELRARNALKMVSPRIKSDGLRIISYLSFRLDTAAVSLGELAPVNDFTNQATSTFLISTNFYRGYQISAQTVQPLTHTLLADQKIEDWAGTNANPLLWNKECAVDKNFCGFGYRASDSDLGGGEPGRFAIGPYFAGFNHSQGDPVADHRGPIDEKTEIVYRVSVDDKQASGQYGTTILYVVSVNF